MTTKLEERVAKSEREIRSIFVWLSVLTLFLIMIIVIGSYNDYKMIGFESRLDALPEWVCENVTKTSTSHISIGKHSIDRTIPEEAVECYVNPNWSDELICLNKWIEEVCDWRPR